MREESEIETMLEKVILSLGLNQLHGMTYKEGIEEALRWALGELTNEELLNIDEGDLNV